MILILRSKIQFLRFLCLFFFNDTATTEIYTLSLHDALPISARPKRKLSSRSGGDARRGTIVRAYHLYTYNKEGRLIRDRKSTRLNSSHANISYAVFCLKKKKKIIRIN